MIRICQAPKRFVAALNNTVARAKTRQRCLLAATTTPFAVGDADSSAYPPVYGRCMSTFGRKHGVTSDYQFSTVAKEANEVRLEEGGRMVSLNISSLKHGDVSKEVESLDLFGERCANWWTGKAPVFGSCPGVEADGKIFSLPQVSFATGKCSRKQLQEYFDNTWTLTEALFSALQGEEAFMRPPYHNLRHPMIFYYGHPAALYINKLRVAGLLQKPINPYYEVIFETGVDEMSWDDLSKNGMEWPSVAEVHLYRKQVYDEVTHLIQAGLTDEQLNSVNQDSPVWALLMGFEHERIHLETSSVLMAEMPLEHLRFPEYLPAYHEGAVVPAVVNPVQGKDYPINEMIDVPAQTVDIGKSRNFPTYGWDNEYGHRTFNIPAFAASKFMISNGEFLEFVKDGGYAKREYWTETGWEWRAFRNVKWPTMWVRKGPQGHHEYDLRLLFDVVPMPWSLPAMVNFHEATAFANWKTNKSSTNGTMFRVLTELEHRAIREDEERISGDASLLSYDHAASIGGAEMMAKRGYNTNFAVSSMSPVDAMEPNAKGFHDVFGNAWEWTQDYFCALPGFQVHTNYEDFSTPCFDGQHHVIQGGSFISTGNESSVHARFHFRPHFFQHAGFRIVAQADPNVEMVTSDLDAPGPYVGSYPFRRSQAALQAILKGLNKNGKDLSFGNAVRPLNQNLPMNSVLSKHFGALPTSVSSPGKDLSAMQHLAEQIISQCSEMKIDLDGANILEVGCEVGGLSFGLAASTNASNVIGIDHSLQNIEIARSLLAGKSNEYIIFKEGELSSKEKIHPFYEEEMSSSPRMDFRAADPMCLPAEFKSFDLVILNDVVDTISSPNALLGRLGGARGLVKPGGLLIISSAFQWREETTPKKLWLGGYVDPKTKQEVSSKEALVQRLSEDFTIMRQDEVPMLWCEATRVIRGTIQTVSYFIRK